MQPNKKIYRIDRTESVDVYEDENAHLWAVSYADFLMALLSFFILFFSIDTDQRDNLILKLTREVASVSPNGDVGAMGGLSETRQALELTKSFPELLVDIKQNDNSLTLQLNDNLFKQGQFKLKKKDTEEIESLLGLIKKYDGQVKLYFEGHADQSPLKLQKHDYVLDNYILSSFRATEIMNIARRMGFIEQNLFIQGSSSHHRNSRSVSIRIESQSYKQEGAL